MNHSGKRALLILFLCLLFYIILVRGNDIGEYNNADKINALMWAIVYPCCLIPFFLSIRKFIKQQKGGRKIFFIVVMLMLNGINMLFISGVIKFVDYYTTHKSWKRMDVTITKMRHVGDGRHAEYTYVLQSADRTLELSSTLYRHTGQRLSLEICKTNLGIVVANEIYNKQHE